MKRFLLLTVCCLTALGCWAQASDEYVPFVSKLKQWHVLGFCVGPYTSDKFYYFGNKDVAIGEHTYLNLYEKDLSNWGEEYWDEGQDDEEAISLGLFREEDRRVYLYDEETGYEHCVYDFNLQEGDVFDIGWGNEADRCVVTAIGEEVIANQHLRTITFSSVSTEQGGKGGHEEHTWVEGIGDTSRPDYGWIGNYRVSSWSYHVAYMTMLNDEYVYCPLSFYGAWGSNNHVIGQNVVKGEEMQPESYKGQYLLDYEIINNQLHVKGHMWMQSCPDYYIYCKVSPHEGNYSKYQIVLTLEEVMPHTDCISTPHAVDLYFNAPIFEESYEFVVIDYDGEHAVPQRSSDYRPFIEEGKVWKGKGSYYAIGKDTIVEGRTCKMLNDYCIYEEDKKVYIYDALFDHKFHLLYDFGANVGDEFTIDLLWNYGEYTCKVTKIDTLLTRSGREHRCIYVRAFEKEMWNAEGFDEEQSPEYLWIEGIGAPNDPVLCVGYFDLTGGSITSMDSCLVNGQLIFQKKDLWGIPFIEEGKVWKVGRTEPYSATASQMDYYYFERDTLTEESPYCKKMMCRHETATSRWTEYVGTVYEDNDYWLAAGTRHISLARPGEKHLTPLYIFPHKAGESINIGHVPDYGTCYVAARYILHTDQFEGLPSYRLPCTEVWFTPEATGDADKGKTLWCEGVGSIWFSPLHNGPALIDDNEHLLSCTVGNDTLFHNPQYTESISTVWEEPDAEVKKEKIDFTHVVKTKPTMPHKVADNGAQEAKVGAEVSEVSLDIMFSGLSGSYTVSLRNEADEQVFAQRVETDNLRSLDVRLTDYEAGRYTITVENDQEAYFASFHFEGSAIRPVGSEATDATLYDLTGRRISHRPTRGIYIQGGRKRVVR